MSWTNASSCSICDGTATPNVTGGTPPYSYYWYPGGSTNATNTGLCPGYYTVVVQDSFHDTAFASVLIGPASISVTMSSTNSACSGNTGTASANVTGGASPYTYLWTPGGGTTATITGLSSGVYSVSVTDANGCNSMDSVYVGQNHLWDSTYTTGTTCAGNDGTAQVSPFFGTSPYTYSWAPGGQTTATVTGLTAGSYTVTVTDNGGCTLTTAVTVANTGLTPTIVTGDDSCYGQANGFASITSVSGGVAPYTYSWSPVVSSNNSITGLSAGNYSVTITDKNGCSSSALTTIYQPGPLSFYADTVADTGSCSGSAWIIASGGTGPYTYTWSAPVNMYMDSLGEYTDSLCAGAYLVCITDAHGCSNCDSVHIRHAPHPTGVGNIEESVSGMKLYPNPVSSSLNIVTDGLAPGAYTLNIYDMIGRQVMQNNIKISTSETIPLNVSGLPDGKYMLRLSNASSNRISPFIVSH